MWENWQWHIYVSKMNKYKNLKFKAPAISYIILFFFIKDIKDSNVRTIMSELFIMSSNACCIFFLYSIDQPEPGTIIVDDGVYFMCKWSWIWSEFGRKTLWYWSLNNGLVQPAPILALLILHNTNVSNNN